MPKDASPDDMKNKLDYLQYKEHRQLVGTFVNNRTNEITFLLEKFHPHDADEQRSRYKVSEMTLA